MLVTHKNPLEKEACIIISNSGSNMEVLKYNFHNSIFGK